MSDDIRPRVRVPAQATRGEVIEILAMLNHPNESGFRPDPESGGTFSRHIVESFTCRLDGRLVFEAELQAAVSASPFLAFEMIAETGGTLIFEWRDDRRRVFSTEAKLAVA